MKTRTHFQRMLFVGLMLLTLAAALLVSMSIDPPRVEAQKPQVTATPRVIKSQPTPTPQVKKPSDVHIPHHRPGHLAKTKNLNDLVVGGQNDPLAGNYTLVNWERIATFWTGTDNQVNTKIYAENETLGNPVPKAKNAHNMTIKAMDVATGQLLRNDRSADTIGVGVQSDGSIWLYTSKAASDLGAFTDGANVNTESKALIFNTWPAPIAIAPCTDCGGATGYDAIFLAFQRESDGAFELQKYDTFGESLTPTGNGNWTFTSPTNYAANTGTLDIASGDFKGNGYPDVAVAWADPQGGTLHLRVFSSIVPDRIFAAYTIPESMIAPYVSIATGDVNGDARDEIIVVWGGTQSNHTVKIGVFQVAQDLSAISPITIYQIPDSIWQPTVAVGDFSLDGVDEIVVSAKAWHNAEIYLYVFALGQGNNNQWQLTQKANLHTGSIVSNYPRLAAGDVNRDVKAEIVTTFTTGQTNNAQVFEVNAPSSGAWSIASKGKVSDEQSANDGFASVFVALGNLDAKQLRVGPPSHTLASNVLSTLAVIGMPPKHKDTIGGTTYVIDSPNTYAKYENQQKTSTQMSTSAKHAWDLSADFSYGFAPIFKMSIKATYGGDFEKTTTTFKSTTFAYGLTANVDDGIVYSVQDIDVWEYPTYADGSDVPVGYMVVMFPQKIDPTCSTNCEGAKIQTNGGSLITSPYSPNHEPYDLLSYSLSQPTNISTTIKVGGQHVMGDLAWYESVAWSDVQSDSTKQTERAGIGVEGSIGEKEAPGHLDLKSSYNFTHIGTNQTSFQQDTTISVWGDRLADGNKYAYTIEPYFYWSKGGTLMLDYLVATNAIWWTNTYNQPDPAFNLPWKDGSQGDQYRLMTREITFDSPSPQAGDQVTITAKIRNYSLVAAQNVQVAFYKGDPDHGGPQFGSVHTIAQLNSQSSAIVVEHLDTSAYANQTLNIYVKISPYPNEIHPDNNKAYARLPVKPRASRASPATLSVASGEITFHSAPATLGVPTHITATVRARGDTFTNLALEFWDGEPYRNGSTIIGGHLIPMVQRDQAVTDGIRWIPRGAAGQRAIWVVIRGSEQEDAYSDNRAYKMLYVVPGPIYFPFISK